ncbi:MAG: F0F1 ATP synthase subunit epsilon [Actinomycetia bacterium]|nr:F0F1 ATP synthase subunit epsilon [Actinomycetes bacterium]
MTLQVQLVAADRSVWSGEATMVIARTLDGDLGILTGHVPVLGELADGVVLIKTTDGEVVSAAVHGGFISVENDTVSLLAEVAELSNEIDVDRARAALERASSGGEGDESLSAAQSRAETRLRATEAHP